MSHQAGSGREDSLDVQGRSANINIFRVLDDGSEQLLAASVDAKEVDELQDWWRYSKPLGSGIKIVVRADSQMIASFNTAGTESGLAAEARHPEIFIG
jgi:hypothetical protein